MNRKKLSYRLTKILSLIILTMLLIVQYAYADVAIDIGRSAASISINETCTVSGKEYPLKDIEIRLWKIADVTSGGKFVYLDEWKPADVPIINLSGEEWKDAAQALLAFAQAKETAKEADYSQKTDESGKAVFENLKVGLYLAAPEKAYVSVSGGGVRLERAMLISVPYKASEDSAEWIYDVQTFPKNEFMRHITPPPVSTQTTYTVNKVWKGENEEAERPEHIYVRLLCDGEDFVGETGVVKLTSPDWSYTWQGLEMGHTYTVKELYVPQGYTSQVKGNVITNTFRPELREADSKAPQRPEADSKASTYESVALSPKTGDEMQLALWITAAIAAAAIFVLILRKNAKKR